MIELKKWAKEDSVVVVIFKDVSKEGIKEERQNHNVRDLQINMLYNPRYREEKNSYSVNLDALRSYYSLSYPR
ncbi:MAG: hypothetical protein ACFFBC_12735 [Promethearchaeota archaeon]